MARREIGAWGIDLGQCALKAIRLQKQPDGQMTATAFDYIEHPKILSQPDADPDALTREALEKFLSRNSLRGDVVAISVPGQSGLARFVKLPPVEEKKINDIVRFEAKQQIPFNLDEVVWDYQKIGSGIVTDGFAMETEIGLFAMKRDMIGKYLQHFMDVNVEVHVVQMTPLALCNFAAYDLLNKGAVGHGEEEGEVSPKTKNCVVALDIGADSSSLVITDGERIIWQRPIPLGGNHFTRALTKDLKLTFAKAEHMKRNATKTPDLLKKILAALKPVLNDFVGEVQRSLGYFTNTHRDARIDYMVGLGNAFRLPGLQRFLAEKLQLDVRKLSKLERLGGEVLNAPTYSENVLGFAVAYGLALQGLEQARLVTNLLPAEIRTERIVRAKKPWAATAAACLLFTSGAMALDAYLEYRSYGDKLVIEAEKKADEAAKRVTAAETAFKAAQDKANAEVQAVRAIVAGQAEQRNWLRITKFIGDIIPQPDGINFPPQHHDRYWNFLDPARESKGGMRGEQAYREYKQRLEGQTGGVNEHGALVEGDELGQGIDDLIQFNIEGVDCRYTEDLHGYWENVRKSMQTPDPENVRPAADWTTPPEGSGWVVELQGYTYHYERRIFVLQGLVENIARVGAATPPADSTNASSAKSAETSQPKPSAAATPSAAAAPPAASEAPAAGPGNRPGRPGARRPGGQAARGGADAPAAAPAAAAATPTPAAPSATDSLDAIIKEPIKISHVVLFQANSKPVSGSGAAEALSVGSVLDSVVKGGGGAPGGPAPSGGAPGGPGGKAAAPAKGGGGSSRDSWSPLVATKGGGGGTFAAVDPVRRGPGAPSGTVSDTAKHYRTDFVILFVWKEPTPSDALRQPGGK